MSGVSPGTLAYATFSRPDHLKIRMRSDELLRAIEQEVTKWPGVSAVPHRFGGVEFRYNGKAEIGHVHRGGMVDIPFPVPVREQLVTEKRASKHHVLPESGWTSYGALNYGGKDHALWLLRLSYLRYAMKQDPTAAEVFEETPMSEELRRMLDRRLSA